jgi:hypothetical protein
MGRRCRDFFRDVAFDHFLQSLDLVAQFKIAFFGAVVLSHVSLLID